MRRVFAGSGLFPRIDLKQKWSFERMKIRSHPLVSVIIKTYNRSESLRETLKSLEAQQIDDSLSWEIVVVDNNSQDDTKRVVHDFARKSRVPCRYVFEPQQGRPYALNRGIDETESELLAFTDDDVIVDSYWLQSIVDTFRQHDADFVGGKVLPRWLEGLPPSWIPKQAFGSLDYGSKMFLITDPSIGLWGANQAARRSTFRKFGIYDTRCLLTEDTEFIWRVILGGGRGIYQPKSIVYHKIPKSSFKVSYLFRCNYRRGKIRGFTRTQVYEGKALFKVIPNWLVRKLLQRLLTCLQAIILQWDVQTAFYEFIQFIRHVGEMRGLIEARLRSKS